MEVLNVSSRLDSFLLPAVETLDPGHSIHLAHGILVSAPVPIGLGFWVKVYGDWTLDLGLELDNNTLASFVSHLNE